MNPTESLREVEFESFVRYEDHAQLSNGILDLWLRNDEYFTDEARLIMEHRAALRHQPDIDLIRSAPRYQPDIERRPALRYQPDIDKSKLEILTKLLLSLNK